MNDTAVRAIAQSDPVPGMTARAGTLVADARRKVSSLVSTLQELDGCVNLLEKHHNIKINADLGPIGNAAAAARRDLERERPGNTFRMPDADARGNDGFGT